MNNIIIYGSEYGTTERYAMELSRRTGIKALSYETVRDLSKYDTIIYLGGLYAGGILGLSKTIKLFPHNNKQEFILVTVGLTDTKNSINTDNIKSSIKKQLPENIYKRTQIFHLRGGIDYQKLGFIHKTMMSFLYNKMKKTSPEKQTQEAKELIETYNQKVDFVDFNSLSYIIEYVMKVTS